MEKALAKPLLLTGDSTQKQINGQAIMIPSGGHILLIPKQQTTGDNVKAQIVPEGTNVTISLKDAAGIIDAHQGIFFSPREI